MARSYLLSDIHMKTMAILGCGHEETCKAHLLHLRDLGWIGAKTARSER